MSDHNAVCILVETRWGPRSSRVGLIHFLATWSKRCLCRAMVSLGLVLWVLVVFVMLIRLLSCNLVAARFVLIRFTITSQVIGWEDWVLVPVRWMAGTIMSEMIYSVSSGTLKFTSRHWLLQACNLWLWRSSLFHGVELAASLLHLHLLHNLLLPLWRLHSYQKLYFLIIEAQGCEQLIVHSSAPLRVKPVSLWLRVPTLCQYATLPHHVVEH